MPLVFTPDDGLENTTSFPTRPANETQARQQLNELHKQTRDYINSLEGGWTPAISSDGSAEAWAYSSATTITIPGDLTSIYSKGDWLRWKQGGSFKYNNVIGITYNSGTNITTLTIHSGYIVSAGDSSFVNAAITDNWYSKSSPVGVPAAFTFVPVLAGQTTEGSFVYDTQIGKFRIKGGICWVAIYINLQSITTPGSGAIKVKGLPVVNAGSTLASITVGPMYYLKVNGTAPLAFINSGASEVFVYGYNDNSGMGTSDISTAGTNAQVTLTGIYTY